MLTAFTLIGALTATSLATETTEDTTITDVENKTIDLPFMGMPERMLDEHQLGGGLMFRRGHKGCSPRIMRNIEVSEEYQDSVNSILEADTDVHYLILEGYNVTIIRPVIKSIVEADGTISSKATTAVVMMQNGTSGYAIVDLDLSEAKVTQIVIFTRTVIDKTIS